MNIQNIINASSPIINVITDHLSYLRSPEVQDHLAETAAAAFAKISSTPLGSSCLGMACSYHTLKSLRDLKASNGYIKKIIPLGKTIVFGTISSFALMNRTPGYETYMLAGACIGALWASRSSKPAGLPLDKLSHLKREGQSSAQQVSGSQTSDAETKTARTKAIDQLFIPMEIYNSTSAQELRIRTQDQKEGLQKQIDSPETSDDARRELAKKIGTLNAVEALISQAETYTGQINSHFKETSHILISRSVTDDVWNKYVELVNSWDDVIDTSSNNCCLNTKTHEKASKLVSEIAKEIEGTVKDDFLSKFREIVTLTLQVNSSFNKIAATGVFAT